MLDTPIALDQVQGRARGKIEQGRMKAVDRCVVRERFGQFQFGQRFVLPDVDCFQAPPPGTEIEELLLLCSTDVIEARHRAIDSGQRSRRGPVRGRRAACSGNLSRGVFDPFAQRVRATEN